MGISVVVPVGPYPANKRWLKECIDSIEIQSIQPDMVILVDDGAELELSDFIPGCPKNILKMPWRTGISHAFNYGVMLAPTDRVFMLGSDDTLEPECLEKCTEAWLTLGQADGYYSVPIRYMDTGEVQTAPCNAAMVTKGFWRLSGGFPIETSLGIGDSTLLSICMAHNLPVYWTGHVIGQDDTPLYNYRRHPDIHTYKIPWEIADPLRGLLTRTWDKDETARWSAKYDTTLYSS